MDYLHIAIFVIIQEKIADNFLMLEFKAVTQRSPDLSRIFVGKVTKLNFLFRSFAVTN